MHDKHKHSNHRVEHNGKVLKKVPVRIALKVFTGRAHFRAVVAQRVSTVQSAESAPRAREVASGAPRTVYQSVSKIPNQQTPPPGCGETACRDPRAQRARLAHSGCTRLKPFTSHHSGGLREQQQQVWWKTNEGDGFRACVARGRSCPRPPSVRLVPVEEAIVVRVVTHAPAFGQRR